MSGSVATLLSGSVTTLLSGSVTTPLPLCLVRLLAAGPCLYQPPSDRACLPARPAEGMNEDGSFIGQYGRGRRQQAAAAMPPPAGDKVGTFV